ncbi:MAG TPA: TIGR02281 family clan AA aspartic protease [Allosphingosinicella sp.]|nr:TIGR02281 family clan AA aspartic protease [Allosphingosinicella sp.]
MTANGDQALNFIYLIGCLVLVVSALLVRRIPIGQGLKMFAGWVLIFTAAFVAFTLKDDFIALGKRVAAEAHGEGEVVRVGKEMRIRKSLDGHFWINARLNGAKVHFLVDSGATVTSISADTARRAQIDADDGFPVLVQTANGTVAARRATAERLVVGTIERRGMAVEVSDAFGDMNVLGMNFLSSLSSWSVQGQWLVLKP